jgi:uncharacterized membrane protein YbaN (DUF454 family)
VASVIRIVLIVLGTLFLALGAIGVILPGLPTTPFLLLAAAMYVRSSERLYSWILHHRIFGRMIREFRETRSISLRAKLISMATMWAMILLSVFLLIETLWVQIVVLALGIVGTTVLLLIPTAKRHHG